MDDIYKNIEENNLNKQRNVSIVFDDMIADMLNTKKLNSIVNKLFKTARKLNISLAFITKSSFGVPKSIRLNFTHYFIMKIPYTRELKQVAFDHSSDIDFSDFMKLYKKCTAKPYSFLVATLASDNPSRFRENLLEKNIKTNHDN